MRWPESPPLHGGTFGPRKFAGRRVSTRFRFWLSCSGSLVVPSLGSAAAIHKPRLCLSGPAAASASLTAQGLFSRGGERAAPPPRRGVAASPPFLPTYREFSH